MNRPTRSLALAAVLSLATPLAALAAGNVTAVVQRGSLKITGDGVGNAVHIVSGGAPETWDVESLDGITTVNGSLAPFHAVGVENNVKIDMLQGDDEVVFEDATLDKDLEMVGGVGSDTLLVDDSHVSGNVRISGGPDDDVVVLGTSSFGGSVVVQTDAGTDSVTLDLVTASDRVKLATGTGVDGVTIGGASQFFDVVTIAMANGNDDLAIDDAAFMRKLDVSLGEDDDTVSMSNTTTKDLAIVNGGPETDVVTNGPGNVFDLGVTYIKIETVL
jgi:hypothetical protein